MSDAALHHPPPSGPALPPTGSDHPAAGPRPVAYCFEGLRLDPVARTLKLGETELRLSFRLFETLLAFVTAPDGTLTSQALLETVWPNRSVDAGNSARAVSSLREVLRKAGLRPDLILTVPGRGYRLGCQVSLVAGMQATGPDHAEPGPTPATDLPTGKPILHAARRRQRIRWLLLAPPLLAACLAGILWGTRLGHAQLELTQPGALLPGSMHNAIAVLPFANPGGTDAGQRLADGLPTTLADALAGLQDVRVAAPQSSFPLARSGASPQQIGSSLQVGLVLQGSVLWAHHRIEIVARLVDARTGRDLWTRTLARDEDDLLALQDELVGALVTSLHPGGSGSGAAIRTAGAASNAQAFDFYLRGMRDRSEVDAESNRRAIGEFDETIRLDPSYALAYAQRARALMYAAANGSQADRAQGEELYRLALADATHAITLSPDLGIGHAALGYILKCGLRNIPAAVAEYRRAAALMPGNTTVMMSQAFMDLDLGHFDAAIAEARRAIELNPLSGASHRMFAALLGMSRHFAEAAVELDRAAQLAPAEEGANRVYAARLAMMNHDVPAALSICRTGTDIHALWCRAWASNASGDQPAARDALRRLQAILGDGGAYEYAELYAQWGDLDRAASLLQEAARLRLPSLIEAKVDPLLDPIRGLKAYKDVIAGLGFPD